jgi:hypothetical protein
MADWDATVVGVTLWVADSALVTGAFDDWQSVDSADSLSCWGTLTVQEADLDFLLPWIMLLRSFCWCSAGLL